MRERRARRASALAGQFVAALALIFALAATASAAVPTGFQDTTVISGLNQPTSFRFSPDGRIFVAEKPGQIWVYEGIDDNTPDLFADLRKQTYDARDRGLLGFALDPQFPAEPYVYALYTFDHVLDEEEAGKFPRWGQASSEYEGDPLQPCASAPGVDACPVSGRLVRLTAEGNHAAPNATAPAEHVLIEDWCQQWSSHSQGDLAFGPEGALFASAGEGASFLYSDYGQSGYPNLNQCGDPPSPRGTGLSNVTGEGGSLRSQDVLTLGDPTGLDGTVIRIDPVTGEGWPGNPLDTSFDANARRIIATGFRNPFRFSINAETREVYVNNVGNATTEEIDRFSTAPTTIYNSGWPCYEGDSRNGPFDSLNNNVCEGLYSKPGQTSPPFFSYPHNGPVTSDDKCDYSPGAAISGSAFYDGADFPSAYDGALFFSESIRGCVYAMFTGKDGRPEPSTTIPFLTGGAGRYPGVDFEVGPVDGALYYAQLFGSGFGPGSIHRVAYFSENQPPEAKLKATPEWAPGDLVGTFDAGESSDAEDGSLAYEWDLEGDGSYEAASANAVKTKEFADSANHLVAVRVRDAEGATSVARVTVYPHDTPPEPVITSPVESALGSGVAALQWRVGDGIVFSGVATDAEDAGQLLATRLDWSSRLAHCPGATTSACHLHPLQAFPTVAAGVLTAPEHDYPSFIELTLRAKDSRGLSAERTIRLDPSAVQLLIRSEPEGAVLTAGNVSRAGPFSVTAIAGSTNGLAAPQTVELGGIVRNFLRWSDGGARVHSIIANGAAEYVAIYSGAESPPAPSPGESSGRAFRISQRPHKLTRARSARFVFAADQADVRFQCKLDRGSFKPCRSPKVFSHLREGKHVFVVRPVDAAGKPEAAGRAYRWRIEPRPKR